MWQCTDNGRFLVNLENQRKIRHWYPIFVLTLQVLSWSEKRAAVTLNKNPNAVYHLINSLI